MFVSDFTGSMGKLVLEILAPPIMARFDSVCRCSTTIYHHQPVFNHHKPASGQHDQNYLPCSFLTSHSQPLSTIIFSTLTGLKPYQPWSSIINHLGSGLSMVAWPLSINLFRTQLLPWPGIHIPMHRDAWLQHQEAWGSWILWVRMTLVDIHSMILSIHE